MNDSKVKVLRILNRFNVGGPIYNAAYLTKYLNSELYETFLIGGKPESHEQSADYILNNLQVTFRELKFMRRAVSPFLDLVSLIQIVLIIYKFRPDIIHTHAAKSGLLGRLASLFYYKKVKVVHTYHGNVFEGYFSSFKNKILLIIERFLAKKSDKIIAISRLQKRDLCNKYKISTEEKIEVVPLGFDLSRFSSVEPDKREIYRKEFDVKEKDVLITIVGRVVPIKNHKFFIDVFNYCKSKTKRNIKGLVVGDGSEMETILSYSEQLGLNFSYKVIESDVDLIFTSWRKDIDGIMAASDIVALTSKNEGTPVSIIEAMASGKVAISTDVGGVSDIIENYKTGIVSDENITTFGEHILTMIGDDELRKEIGVKASQESLKSFNYSVLVSNIEKLYESLVCKK